MDGILRDVTERIRMTLLASLALNSSVITGDTCVGWKIVVPGSILFDLL